MPTVLITGANRGIGLEFARQYAIDGWDVLATARDISHVPELKAFAHSRPDRLRIEKLDVTDPESIDQLREKLNGVPIDVLIHNAGVLPTEGADFGEIEYQSWYDTLAVNAIAPVMVTEMLVENVAASEQKKIVAITSNMGSMTEQVVPGAPEFGGYYQYRTSKAALNMSVVLMAKDLKDRGIVVAALNPGWVRTRMGGPGATTSPEESVTAMRAIIEQLTPEHSGLAFEPDASPMPW